MQEPDRKAGAGISAGLYKGWCRGRGDVIVKSDSQGEAAGGIKSSVLLQGKVEVEGQADRVCLLIGVLAGVVLVLVVGIKFDVSSYRK
jgi:hypothetical protein